MSKCWRAQPLCPYWRSARNSSLSLAATKAAGLSMPRENLEPFRKKMNQLLQEIPHIERTEPWDFDMEISLNEINPTLIKNLQKT